METEIVDYWVHTKHLWYKYSSTPYYTRMQTKTNLMLKYIEMPYNLQPNMYVYTKVLVYNACESRYKTGFYSSILSTNNI